MARLSRLSRLVAPGLAHHVTQCGNGRQAAFFEGGDYPYLFAAHGPDAGARQVRASAEKIRG
jgi:hypothetical protein